MLWEGGWEWARLTKSKYISIEVTCPPPPPPPYLLLISILLPLPVNWPAIGPVPPPLSFSLSKVGVSFGPILKKSRKKTSSNNTTFENSEHPYRICGSLGGFLYLFGSSPPVVFLWKTDDFLKRLVQIYDLPWKNQRFS